MAMGQSHSTSASPGRARLSAPNPRLSLVTPGYACCIYVEVVTYLLNTAWLCQAIFATGSVFYIADYEACLICFTSAVPQEPAAAVAVV